MHTPLCLLYPAEHCLSCWIKRKGLYPTVSQQFLGTIVSDSQYSLHRTRKHYKKILFMERKSSVFHCDTESRTICCTLSSLHASTYTNVFLLCPPVNHQKTFNPLEIIFGPYIIDLDKNCYPRVRINTLHILDLICCWL